MWQYGMITTTVAAKLVLVCIILFMWQPDWFVHLWCGSKTGFTTTYLVASWHDHHLVTARLVGYHYHFCGNQIGMITTYVVARLVFEINVCGSSAGMITTFTKCWLIFQISRL